MRLISATSPDAALRAGLDLLGRVGESEPSRNGKVWVAPWPVATTYPNPRNRVSFWPRRDANPFFHLVEAMWMLAGRNDVETVARYASSMSQFSDDQRTLNGAYGHRWRKHFPLDQLNWVIYHLREDPDSRRAVVAMWDAATDPESIDRGTKDAPCNTQVYFRLRREPFSPVRALDMTVTCRSNDIVWGAYGANVVHFSFLQEYVACALGARVGVYVQFSNNYHAYVERPDVQRLLVENDEPEERPAPSILSPSLFQEPQQRELFDRLVRADLHPDDLGRTSLPPIDTLPFIDGVLEPMMRAHALHKQGDTPSAIDLLRSSVNYDWNVAGYAWLKRRLDRQTPTKETRA